MTVEGFRLRGGLLGLQGGPQPQLLGGPAACMHSFWEPSTIRLVAFISIALHAHKWFLFGQDKTITS